MLKPSLDDLIRSSFKSILKNKGRTALTSLGIIIGVTSVILLTSIGNGLQIYINQQFESLGANTVFVAPGKVFNDKGGFSNSPASRLVTTSFTLKDISDLRRNLKNSIISPNSQAAVDISTTFANKKGVVTMGSNYLYGPNNNLIPSAGNGRWFNKEEDDKKSNVAILGYTLAADLFPKTSPLGKKIIAKGKTLKVIGVLDKKGGSFGGPAFDDYLFVPIGIVFEFTGSEKINAINIKASQQEGVEATKVEVNKILLKKYDKDAFSVFDSSQLLSSINSIISTLTIALTGIAAISLIVGGIGIMNIMLVTVTERTREIGLRKAIGAYPMAILVQFLIEAVILSSIGGTVGIALGTLGTLAIAQFFPAQVTVGSIALAFGVSFAVGVIFGVTPARKASMLSPIEALRYE
jgi:putative ABC transport system permease protein